MTEMSATEPGSCVNTPAARVVVGVRADPDIESLLQHKIDVLVLRSRRTQAAACVAVVFAIIICGLAAAGVYYSSRIPGVDDSMRAIQATFADSIPGFGPGSPSTWQRIHSVGAVPPARLAHAAATVGDKMYVFGGFLGTGQEVYGDLWVYSERANEWTRLAATGDAPSARLHHSLVATSDGAALLLFGGFNTFMGQPGHRSFNDLFRLDLATLVWTRLDDGAASTWLTTADRPSTRGAHGAMWLNGAMYVFGGFNVIGATGHSHELWSLSLATRRWTNLTAANATDDTWPDGRIGFALTPIDRTRAHLFGGGCSTAAFAGSDSVAGQCGDDWIFDAAAGTFARVVLADATAPRPRARRATNGDVASFGLVFLFGGLYQNGTSEVRMLDDLWVFDPAGPRWLALYPNYMRGARPPVMFGHTVARLGNKVVVFGGRVGAPSSVGSSELWEYSIVPPS